MKPFAVHVHHGQALIIDKARMKGPVGVVTKRKATWRGTDISEETNILTMPTWIQKWCLSFHQARGMV
eukprot:CAMPEP_0178443388 /NCGR_PEP_ID=MMETSP0689_2-20121128/38868_1 /TAXON_ID=160604 /ORGANISM="Amphidinium massartii, Strain CS-259" /LENGTH=67 /DNA_ID=CAMNT_0020067391 /DNA_START=114 /DNA_END=314 /DNA_ORIENTATION=-